MSQPFPVQCWSTHARRLLLPCPGTHRQQLALLQHGRIQADELNPRRLLKSRQFTLAAIFSAAKVYCKVLAGGSKATCCHILCCGPHHALGLRRPPAHARSEISRKQAARDGIAEGAEARAALSEPLLQHMLGCTHQLTRKAMRGSCPPLPGSRGMASSTPCAWQPPKRQYWLRRCTWRAGQAEQASGQGWIKCRK